MSSYHNFNERQLDLLNLASPPDKDQGPTVTDRPLQSKHATFKGGMKEPVHRWFRLTPSFGPQLVRDVFEELGVNQDATVLDPFTGAGTTLIECQLNAIKSYGFEIHPFLHWTATATLDLTIDYNLAAQHANDLAERFLYLDRSLSGSLEKLPYPIPAIHNPFRWWRPDVLRDLLILKAAIHDLQSPDQYRRFFNLALASVLVPDLTNVTLGRLQLHFIQRDDPIRVWETFHDQVNMMLADLKHTQDIIQRQAQVIQIDSTDLSTLGNVNDVDFVITSPPYPNRYSYVWNTRPHLYFFDHFDTPRQASQLDARIIGGTWGTATSNLQKGIIHPEFEAVTQFVLPVSETIRKIDNLMANYVVKYFNGLTRQLIQMQHILSPEAALAYVVGCSRIKGVYVETDVILANIMEHLPFKCSVNEIRRLRRRHSGKDLFESVVYARARLN